VQRASLADGTPVTIRPIRPEDDHMVQLFLDGVSSESGWNRLLSGRRLTPMEIHHLTRIDYLREMALVALTSVEGEEREVGVARYVVDEDTTGAEFALLIGDAWQHKGVGSLLLAALTRQARSAGLARLHGITFSGNRAMLALAHKFGFVRVPVPSDATVQEVFKELR
jgi:acetyltransferase